MLDYISIRGCRLHNLKNVNAQFPLGKITVVCGPSGCGKSTLVMDTLHGESKRRYLETLSPFAADLLGGKRTIPLDSAEGLPASLAIAATRGEAPAKASALSIAECDNALRTLFAAFAKPACPICGAPMVSQSREEIIREIAGMPIGTKLQFLAKIETGNAEMATPSPYADHDHIRAKALSGQRQQVRGDINADRNDKKKAQSKSRTTLDKLSAVFLAQGFTRALADGTMYSLADLLPGEKVLTPKEFFIIVDRIIVRENTRTRIAEAVDGTLKLTHSAITLDIAGERKFYSTKPCCPNANDKQHQTSDIQETIASLDARAFSPYSRTSVCEYCEGTGIIQEAAPAKINEKGGGKGRAESNVESDEDENAECSHCHGLRLKKTYLNATVDDISYKQILTTEFANLPEHLHKIFDNKIGQNLKATFNSLLDRIEAINDLGIGYLTPGRAGQTLSGGELQRLKLASLSTGHLNGLLIALDEPASGLHASDVTALWKVLEKIRKRGNTLVLIEHNPQIIKRADYIIEMGPGAGEKGGEILFQGNRDEVLENPGSPTGMWIRKLDESGDSRSAAIQNTKESTAILVDNFAKFDMAPVNAAFPINKFSVITGQSGSGKSTLLFENIAKRAKAEEFKKLGIDALSILTTGDFHGSKRSTVLSAIGLTTLLRDLFAKLPESKVRGYTASKFSMHAPGGRCENCKGEGVIYDPLGYEESECPVCLGKRFRDEVLEIRFKSLSIADILDMEIGSAYKLFTNMKPFAEKLKPLVDTGLDYLKLGQTTAHLSGGERARLRLSITLARAKAPNTLFLFDEPARGLHQKDIQQLLGLIHGLCNAGHTVIAIEHAQDFVDAADYVVELKRG
ncbi:ATP-binding cassette domain-containing protein [Fibrobacter sp. UWB13]|uniref:ATP-binding cassette domain-containing protein n=1 Tax=Fibrobacter sp. UWB13 TaxID=1896204 RepID=UPI000A0E358B|nr:ATP-binding cassette domain-containing protein [Fibrobacter sp. UWB13]SMG18434.1 excinuclease ABC subunit A [Fibrobacter sp. UWB13]